MVNVCKVRLLRKDKEPDGEIIGVHVTTADRKRAEVDYSPEMVNKLDFKDDVAYCEYLSSKEAIGLGRQRSKDEYEAQFRPDLLPGESVIQNYRRRLHLCVVEVAGDLKGLAGILKLLDLSEVANINFDTDDRDDVRQLAKIRFILEQFESFRPWNAVDAAFGKEDEADATKH